MSDTLVITSGTFKGPQVDAEGRNVLITGSNLVIELTGHATEVRILGDSHRVSAQTVDSFLIMGSQNEVSVDVLASAKIGGENNSLSWNNAQEGRGSPSISMEGEGNSVSST